MYAQTLNKPPDRFQSASLAVPPPDPVTSPLTEKTDAYAGVKKIVCVIGELLNTEVSYLESLTAIKQVSPYLSFCVRNRDSALFFVEPGSLVP